jgi:hypothetical protein
VVRRGRPLPEGFERTPTLRIFRGSRDGMWRKKHRAGRETHDGAGEPATEAYKGDRNRRGPSWESEGCRVPLEGRGQHNPARGKGPYFVHVVRRVEDQGIASGLSTPRCSGHFRGNCLGRPSLHPTNRKQVHAF